MTTAQLIDALYCARTPVSMWLLMAAGLAIVATARWRAAEAKQCKQEVK